ncbi:hypothetical protein CDAR_259541 [Caerostris darwini]|uniref:Uncharacterized protein n=1 Tax=Caerostris darwini TaxID=1538125 RepID=A0AAV4VMQ2_9ARAC|nr:hypothetical protein CDAR_259541 [Caerostris darwini]
MSTLGREARILFPFGAVDRVGGKRVSASGANPSSGSKRKTIRPSSRLPSHAPPLPPRPLLIRTSTRKKNGRFLGLYQKAVAFDLATI